MKVDPVRGVIVPLPGRMANPIPPGERRGCAQSRLAPSGPDDVDRDATLASSGQCLIEIKHRVEDRPRLEVDLEGVHALQPTEPLAALLALAPPELAGAVRAQLAAAGLDPDATGWPP